MNIMRRSLLLALLAICMTVVPVTGKAQTVGFESPPIDYLNASVEDPVAKLAARIDSGELDMEFDQEHGYLPAVLEHLAVPVSSQVLVFSKTSLQLHRISPRRPRALYFNDDVYVGWCQNGDVVELAATDHQQGAIFYTLAQEESDKPKITRDRGQCLTCHASSRTQNVPGYLVRSVFVNRAGHAILGSGTYTSDPTTPLMNRWGGWYVTGQHGDMRHMGNVTSQSDTEIDREAGANVTDLSDIVSTKPYLSSHSDIVALMVMEHQTQMHNALTVASFETRLALHQSFQMNEWLDREPGMISDSAHRRIESAAENLVEHIFFCNEYQLSSPIVGSSSFAEEFTNRGPFDSQGRSLRQFNCRSRLFEYPCSFLIYTRAFCDLPEEAHKLVVSKMLDVLEGRNQDDKYAHLAAETRGAILEILRETHPSFEHVPE